MVIEILTTFGVSAVTATAARVAYKWNKHNKGTWAQATGDSFLKYCYKKYLQPNKARRNGYAGEYEISRQLDKIKGNKKLLFNVLIPAADGETTEIDALMIHETGIYVLENKNYGGLVGSYISNKRRGVLGNVKIDAKDWTVVYSASKQAKMPNPILQNQKHLFWARRLAQKSNLHLWPKHFFSYVTFNENGKVKGAPLSFNLNVEGRLLMARHLAGEINSKCNCRDKVLSSEQINEIYALFEPYSRVSIQERKEHIKRVKENFTNPPEAKKTINYAPIEQRTPLNDAIKDAKAQQDFFDEDKEKPIMKNYMNMFRR